MKKVSYYQKGEKVYFFSGFDFSLKEAMVKEVYIKVPDVGDPVVSYSLTCNGKMGDVKLDSDKVFSDKEELKKLVLSNFKQEA